MLLARCRQISPCGGLALNEAISHLDQGMQLIGSLPRSPRRHEKELELCTLLGTAWVALRGFGASEAWSSFHRALGLAKTLNRHEALLPIYFGLCSNLVLHGRLAEGLDWVNEMLASAEATGDRDLLIMGHRSACTTYFWLGDFNRSREHGHRVLALYNEEKHRHLADLTNVDPRTVVEIYLSIGTWILGYPDRALQVREAMDSARSPARSPVRHRLCADLWQPGFGFPLRTRSSSCTRRGIGSAGASAQSAIYLRSVGADTQGHRSSAGRATRGKHPTAARCTRQMEGRWRAALDALLAGSPRGRLGAQRGPRRRIELGRRKSRPDFPAGMGGTFAPGRGAAAQRMDAAATRKVGGGGRKLLASLEVAREQQAKSWELRTATSLVRLWRSQGKRQEARELLASVHGWFTEGFATRDLVEAKALLDEIS